MFLDPDDRYQLMKEEEADARDAANPTIVDALRMCGAWHGDTAFDGSRGDLKLDLALGDAFRMIIYLGEPRAQLDWIERQLFGVRVMGRAATPYESTLIRYWLDIFEHEQRSRRNG